MRLTKPSFSLRWVLAADAASSAGAGLLLMLAAEPLGTSLAIPTDLFFFAGLSMLPFAGLVLYVATRAAIAPKAVWAIIAFNALWALDSLLLPATGWVAPTNFGLALVVAQGLWVAVFAEIEYVALRRSMTEAA
ncbi:MAG: hypothetical protein HYR63_21360 [Proteobacteria bacterium]|nr:hypothetical protein [Pseudomonadota bacterium]MBI3500103.1 hypothetical protein [Pseudomonadota bacterium]